MSIKRRIWALPAISALIFGLGVAVSASFSTNALTSIHTTESVDFPALGAAKALGTDIQAVTGGLRDAVSEGDKGRIAQIDEQAGKVRAKLADIAKIDGMQEAGKRLTSEFDAYYAPALSSAKIMLELEQGDVQATVARMQSNLTVLNADVAKFNDSTQQQFKAGIARSESNVRRVLVATIVTALIVIATLAGVSWFVVRAIWQQLGGEPEYARAISRAVAAGDLSMEIRTEPSDDTSVLAALKDMRARLADLMTGIKVSAETHCDGQRRNRHRQRRPGQPHGTPGRPPRTHDARGRVADRYRARQRRQRQPGQPAGGDGDRHRHPRRRGGRQRGQHDGRHQRFGQADRRDHLGHRRHCLPDQYPGAQRGGRSRPCRRAGARLRGRGERSPQPGPALGQCRQGDQAIDRRFGREDPRRHRAGGRGRHDDAGHCRLRAQGARHHGRDRRRPASARAKASNRSALRSRTWTR